MFELFLILTLFIGFIVGRFAHARKAIKHQHIWNVISSGHRSTYNTTTPLPNEIPQSRSTRILSGCFCGEFQTKEIPGHWKAEDLKSITV